jgi:signal transduction histidine kinase
VTNHNVLQFSTAITDGTAYSGAAGRPSSERWNRDQFHENVLGRILVRMQRVIHEGRVALLGVRTPRSMSMSLERTLCNLRDEFSPASGVELRIFVTGSPRELKPAILDQLHRIGREALINALRHSQATTIEAEVQYLPGRLRLVVRDNGCGLDPQAIQSGRRTHWGLTGMRERAEDIGGQLKIRSRLGAGTEVEVSVPAEVALEEYEHQQRDSARA